jgi:hypothetical protein
MFNANEWVAAVFAASPVRRIPRRAPRRQSDADRLRAWLNSPAAREHHEWIRVRPWLTHPPASFRGGAPLNLPRDPAAALRRLSRLALQWLDGLTEDERRQLEDEDAQATDAAHE